VLNRQRIEVLEQRPVHAPCKVEQHVGKVLAV
jgi:hypothetical protein